MEADDDVPSVLLFLKKATTKISEKTGKLWGVVHLEAEINDEEIWKGVESQFRTGMKIYAVENFQEQIIGALRIEHATLTEKCAELTVANEELSDENQSLKAALNIMAQ